MYVHMASKQITNERIKKMLAKNKKLKLNIKEMNAERGKKIIKRHTTLQYDRNQNSEKQRKKRRKKTIRQIVWKLILKRCY